MKTVSDEQVRSFLKLLNMYVFELELGYRLGMRIKSNNICYIWKILICSRKMLVTIPGFGQKTLRELEEHLDWIGLNRNVRKYFHDEFWKYTNKTVSLPYDTGFRERLRFVSWIEDWPSLEQVTRKYLEENS